MDGLAHDVIGAAIEVHRVVGPGLLESVYEAALSIELAQRGIPFVRQALIPFHYKGQPVGDGRIDLWIDHRLIVELKTVERFEPVHLAQVLSYLRMTGCPLGLLINFHVPVLRHGIKRVVLTGSAS